ncbi:MAG: class I SAM-dependent methyltransferase [Sphingomonadales bacterium]|jgi:SAM-dependent methyltransferase
MTTFKDHFSKVAQGYQTYRPTYPKELFQALIPHAPAHDCAWDVGCGNGQASRKLADYFDHVIATDASAEQIASAPPHPKIDFVVAPAEQTSIPDRSVDFILIAQALHWFDFDRFFAEAKRVAKKDAVIAAVAYETFSCRDDIDGVIREFYEGDIAPHWPPERRHIESGYMTIDFPFQEITLPKLYMTAQWSLDDVMGYFSTWSAVNRYMADTGNNPLINVDQRLGALWGDRTTKRDIRWPITIRFGRVES